MKHIPQEQLERENPAPYMPDAPQEKAIDDSGMNRRPVSQRDIGLEQQVA
jgi:hypothetical protein